ncbi:MAG TPA: 50S ribosomal protein L18 [Smithellaceae bacterium]|nr:50S ribosomal protein L18 [Smithellaceae bacterium]HRS82175.1 50S ribosomal protein L18 [Smithellaceae bacterium]HRV44679.1 50S ribosomal protein L18 [Smithellaceae bacterium]
MASKKTLKVRAKREKRVRGKLTGTAERPRLSVFRSDKHIYAQVINDAQGTTIATASTLSKELAGKIRGSKKVEVAREVGKLIAARLQTLGVEKVVFDRGRFLYHGRVKALADGARESGLKF